MPSEYKAKSTLTYSVLATPAEGLSGRFTRMDRRKYGKIKGVTDNDYYVNSFHVDVKEPISIVEKIKREAPFHAITRGGHITYVELDGEAQKNVRAPPRKPIPSVPLRSTSPTCSFGFRAAPPFHTSFPIMKGNWRARAVR